MLCSNCKKQIADDSAQCPFCAHKVDYKRQVPKEISLRRYQRWFFYGLLSIMFVGMVVTIVKIYNVNSELLTSMVLYDQELEAKKQELDTTKAILAETKPKLSAIEDQLNQSQSALFKKVEEYKEILFDKSKLEEKLQAEQNSKDDIDKNVENCERKLEQTDTMVYAMVVSLGVGVSNDNLAKIRIADANLAGNDSDGDELSDAFEQAIGTDKVVRDTDGDGFNDKQEMLGGFNPNGSGNMPLDEGFAKAQAGKILLQVEGSGEAWYISPKDFKRYFLGNPAQALELLANL